MFKEKAKQVISVILTLIIILMTSAPAFAETNDNTVVVGYFPEPGMMDGAEEGAVKSGYVYECMMEIAAHAGWKYTYVYGPYEELSKKLLNGEIDILPFISSTPLRREQMLFPDNGMADETFYLASLEGLATSSDFHELNNKRIGSTTGYFQNEVLDEFLEKYNLNCEIILYPTPHEKWAAMQNHEVDITVESSLTVQPFDFRPICKIGDSYPIYAVISKNRPDLLEQFNAAQLEIDTENPTFLAGLRVKYFKGIPLFKSLSDRAKEWIENHSSLRIGVFNNDAPLVFKDDDGIVKGVMPDYINTMFHNYGVVLPIKWVFYDSNEEALNGLRAGEIDAIHPYYPSYNLAEQEGVIISSVVYSSPMGLLYEGDYKPTTMNRIATPYTRLGAHYVEDNYPNATIIPCLNGYDCIDKMLAGEADGCVLNSTALKKIASNYNKNFNIKTLHTLCDTCFATLPENSAIIDIINSTSQFLSNEEINAIEASYYVESDTSITPEEFFRRNPNYLIGLTAFVVAMLAILIFLIIKRRVETAQNKILEEARNAADAANRSKTSFLFNMSHDIRTPMNAITGFTSMAKKNLNDTEKVAEFLDKIEISGQQLLTLVNKILEMARIESGKIELDESPVNIKNEFNSIVTILSEQATTNGLSFSPSLENIEHNFVFADQARMSSITLNITGNAMKYTPRGGSVDFIFREIPSRKEGYASYVFTVSDTGIGMSKEFMKTLFEPFSREKNSTVSKIQGAGLGMSIVKSIVELMGGNIDVQSEPGKGTRFDITLDFMIDNNPSSNADLDSDISSDSFIGRRILLVEDNELNREIAMEILDEEHLSVEDANDGTTAIKLLKEKGPDYYDFILMDIQMPIMGGYEATQIIRSMYPDKHIPIIALSANAFAEDKAASLAAGMDDHVAKPINIKELYAALAKFL